MRPNAQLFYKRRAHDHQVRARDLCKQPRERKADHGRGGGLGDLDGECSKTRTLDTLSKSQPPWNPSYAPAVTPRASAP